LNHSQAVGAIEIKFPPVDLTIMIVNEFEMG